jgi:hypothetical protein
MTKVRQKLSRVAVLLLLTMTALVSIRAVTAQNLSGQPTFNRSVSLSATSFDFGGNLVNNTVTKTVVTITNTGPRALHMSPTITGDTSFAIVVGQSCHTLLLGGESCPMVVSYTPRKPPSWPNSQSAVLNMNFAGIRAGAAQTVALSGISAALTPGTVTATHNPQVALYTLTLPFPGSVNIKFGTTTNYGHTTWSQSTNSPGRQVNILVAAMKANTQYHMAAAVSFANGISAQDTDHTFTTGAPPAAANLALSTTTSPGLTPQAGLEMINTLGALAVSDLSGNILWSYIDPGGNGNATNIQGVKLLPNGDIIMVIGAVLANPLDSPAANAILELREVNLAGDTVREVTVNDLNVELSTATCAECNVTLETFHHDITVLPNGHWLVLGNTQMNLSSVSMPSLTNAPAQPVLGDVVVDLDENLHPVWAWNEFNHLDPNRHPMLFPDWTHSNAILYSPDDGNFLVSMRHQNWVVKVDYANGQSSGKILWRLGQGGDFTLQGGTDPTDWAYAQHTPAFFSSNTSGSFSLGVMDNGDDRMFPPGVTCGTNGGPPCFYSSIPIFKIDEAAMTATLTFHQILPVQQYSLWGGNVEQLANGNVEYNLTDVAPGSYIYEVTNKATPQTVWTMVLSGTNAYRAFRIPSLYPGVQW